MTINGACVIIERRMAYNEKTAPRWPYADNHIKAMVKTTPTRQTTVDSELMRAWLKRAPKSDREPDKQRICGRVFNRHLVWKACKHLLYTPGGDLTLSLLRTKSKECELTECLAVQRGTELAFIMPMRDLGAGKDPLRLRWW